MRITLILLALLAGGWAGAQDAKAPDPEKKAAARKKVEKKKAPVAHKKATPEQIRKFNELEKQEQKK